MADVPDNLTIEEFGRRLRAGSLSALAVTDACLRRIDARNGTLNAFMLVMADEARRRATAADVEIAAGRDRGPLHGVPVSVKDLIDIAGVPTTAASRLRDGHVAPADAPVIAHLRRRGAVLIGKTNLHEFAYGTTSEDSAYGPVRHPLDPTRSPGGSSGGSAVSVVTGMALGSLGTDTGGSIRIPAAACGIVGLKPALDEVPTGGVVPLSRTLDHVGPFARTVADVSLLYRVLVDSNDATPLSSRDLRGIRLGLPRGYFFELLDRDVRARVEGAVATLERGGVRVDEVRVPHAPGAPAVYVHIHAPEGSEYHARTLEAAPDRYTRPVRMRLELGRYVLAEDHVRAMRARDVLRREVDDALTGFDALILPTLPIVAPPLGAESVVVNGRPESVRALMLRLTQLFNLTGHPAISLPCGTTPQGLPCGVQLVGRRGDTPALLQVAGACEACLDASNPGRDRPSD